MTNRVEALVIGGGPAGAAAALRLAAAGRGVVLCERQAQPHGQVCGEFISASAAAELDQLGMAPAALGAAEITRTRIIARDVGAEAHLPFPAYGLSRTRLDGTLVARAAPHGVELRLGVGVRTLERHGGGWRAALSDGRRIEAPAVILATGKHELRGRQRTVRGPVGQIGFKMHWRLSPDQDEALGNQVELYLYDGGYIGLQRVEGGAANLCLVIAAETYRIAGASWPAALAHLRTLVPMLDARLQGARPLGVRPSSVARMPYGYVCPDGDCADGLYRIGDQFAVIPSFTGEGIALALRTARLAAEAALAREPAERFVATARRDILPAMRAACLLEAITGSRTTRQFALRLGRLPGVLPALARYTRIGSRPAIVPVGAGSQPVRSGQSA
jgi:flavin-dependent dehydrogenase